MTPDPADFRAFLADALAHGWPDNTRPSKAEAFPGFVEGHYQVGDWRYVDLWAGATTDVGVQFIFFREKIYWGCTYRGGIVEPDYLTGGRPLSNQVFRFLVQALRKPALQGLPIRGPAKHTSDDGRWTYILSHQGTLDSFFATEQILDRDLVVYERLLTGGLFGDGVLYGPALGFPPSVSS